MTDWKVLRNDLPAVVEELCRMLIEDTFPALIGDDLVRVDAWPTASIELSAKDGSGSIVVRLSIGPAEEAKHDIH